MSDVVGPSLFGKIPREGDFVRVGSSPLTEALDRWVSGAILAGRAEGREAFPAGGAPVGFVFRPPHGTQLAVGVAVPSRDRVGRRFPLLAFQTVDVAELAGRWAGLPAASRAFRREVELMTRDLESVERARLADDIRGLPPLIGPEVQEAEEDLSRRLRATNLDIGARRTFGLAAGDLGPDQLGFAAYTLQRIFVSFGRREDGQGRVLVDLPVAARGEGGGVDLWASLFGLGLRWKGPPSMLWTPSRLLVSLGSAPAEALPLLNQPGSRAPNMWPVRSDNLGVLARVRASLDPQLRSQVSRPDASLHELWFRLARGTSP